MSIKERMKQVIAANTSDRTRYVQLKELTGISADIWKNFWFERREPDANMVEKLAKAWPVYAFWLATGISDKEYGHVTVAAKDPNIPTRKVFEERLRHDDFSGVDAKRIRDGLRVLAEYGIGEDKEEYSPGCISRIEFFEKLRKVIFFLENYILDMNIDDSINAFNRMLGEVRSIEGFARENNELDAYDEAISRLAGFKEEIDKRNKWLIQNASTNEK